MKKLFLILTVLILSISFYPVSAMEKTADILKKNIVTKGDGLYVDPTIDGRYIYRGANPNNYIRLGDNLYRIISLEKDGTIKVIKQESIGGMKFDEIDARLSENSNDFCSRDSHGYYDGCNVWGSKTTTLDSSGNQVTQMPWEVNGTLKNLPDKEASLNTYLNNGFYNSLSDDVKSLVVENIWNVGPTAWNQVNLSESIKEESTYKWKGKVALMNATDYVKASTNSACSSVQKYMAPYLSGDSSCYNNSSTHNYLFTRNMYWTISPHAYYNSPADALNVTEDGYMSYYRGYEVFSVRPTFFLSSETTLNGEGTEINPYTITKYVEEVKEEENNNEVKVDEGEVVEVPSTSAQMSIIIASIGVIFISLAIILTKRMTKKQ